ncbi:hypothetical protein C8E03_108168 [Lachnotalea glycerini]|uniref:Uncharacterized protein n=1 Tax=Lachnotalea glycerini TaxID=1763509 RepID=A0A318EK30_9FIRM|nr:hypothetical protein [Lachnotalea glycerini]PXV88441.1 hypothetical protein C8E03_108168 [Lachnotalea glycerini]
MRNRNPKRHFKIKERKLMTDCTNVLPIISWVKVDICDKCFNNLVQLRYEGDLIKRIEDLSYHYDEKYPNDVDMQSAYLQGIQDCIDILLPTKLKDILRKE